jgi:hypothetical protein
VPLISTLNTVSCAGEETQIVRSTGILPKAIDIGDPPGFDTSTFKPSDILAIALTRLGIFRHSAACLISGTTDISVTEIGATAIGLLRNHLIC